MLRNETKCDLAGLKRSKACYGTACVGQFSDERLESCQATSGQLTCFLLRNPCQPPGDAPCRLEQGEEHPLAENEKNPETSVSSPSSRVPLCWVSSTLAAAAVMAVTAVTVAVATATPHPRPPLR